MKLFHRIISSAESCCLLIFDTSEPINPGFMSIDFATYWEEIELINREDVGALLNRFEPNPSASR